MSVLARDIDAYQRAVEAYQRQLRGYNNTVNNYNDSFFTDANGNLYTATADGAIYTADPVTGQLTLSTLPEGKTLYDFGLTPNKSNSNYLMLRQNPTEVSKRTYDNVIMQVDMDGNPIYLIANSDGSTSRLPLGAKITGSRQVQEPDSEGNLITRTIYSADENTSTYLAEPGDPTFKLRANRPDPTAAQLRKLSQPGLAEQERTGIISDEIIKGRVLGGQRTRAGGTNEPPPPPDDPINPYDPWDPNVNPMIP